MGVGPRRHLLIFPCNGNGLEALDCLGADFECIGFVDDAPEKQGTERYGYRVYNRSAFDEFREALVLAAPGSPDSFRSRRELIESIGIDVSRFARVIHRNANVSVHAKIGHNVLIMAGVVITSNVTIGDNVCILPNTVVQHDTTIGDWSLIGASVVISGGVKVGENCYIGSGSRVKNGLAIGSRTMLGLGSNVIRNVEANQTVAGNPARPVQ